MPVQRTAKTNRTKTATLGYQSRPSGSPELSTQAADNDVWQSLEPFPFDPSQSLGPPESSQIPDIHAVGSRDAVTTRGEPFASHSPFLDTANHAAIADGVGRDTRSSSHARRPAARLELLTLDEWNENETYDEDPPTCLHYSIEWKVTLNNKLVSKDTEPNLVLAPRFYWSLFLREKLDKLLQKKLSPSKRVTCEDTNVVVSVTDRSERDLTKRFDERDVDWFLVEKQFLAWGESFRAGKKLRVDVSFNYVEIGQQATVSTRRAGKRGGSSATQQMLTERDSQLDAEEGDLRQPSIWQDVYNLMRCPGPPCNLGPHCWRDPHGKKHYKLRTHQLKGLIRHVEQGGQLRSHDDVPEDIRQQVYAEEQQQIERQRKATSSTSSGHPPIHITNVLPGPPHTPSEQAASPSMPRLDIHGFLDVAVEEYSDWQQSRVRREDQKNEIRKLCSIALDHGLDLQQLYDDQDPSFFVKEGVKVGIARRFIRDIQYWVQQPTGVTGRPWNEGSTVFES
jgi:hypothetical protein